jgi:hypothetical protein
MPRFPSAPSDWPFSVKNVAPEDPVRTSTDCFALNVATLPFFAVTPAQFGSSLPSTQTLIQAGPPLISTTRVTPL